MSVLLLNDPSRFLDQHFSLSLNPEDFFSSLVPREFRTSMRCPDGYSTPWRSTAQEKDSGSTASFDKDKFQVNLDVQQFKPEEITVKVNENTITVEGKHEEKEDERGSISRHFVRRYVLPEGHDIGKVESKLSSDGILTITAPKIQTGKEECRSVPVIQTGQPSKALEPTEEKKNEK